MTMKGLRGSRQHLLGKRIRMDARLPDGSIQRLIQIDRWNFKWQGV